MPPRITGQLVGSSACLSSPLGGHSDGGAVKSVTGFGAHAREDAPTGAGQASRYRLRSMERRAQRGRRNVPKAAAKVTSASGGIADNTRTCRWLDLVANDPSRTFRRSFFCLARLKRA